MKKLSRRDLLTGTALFGTVPALASGCADEREHIVAEDALEEGVALIFQYPPQHEAFIVKLGRPAEGGVGPDGDIVAFHTACPHMGCPINPAGPEQLGTGVFGPCRCHQSTFDLKTSGRQIYGRATQNLVRVLIESDLGEIYAVGIEGLPFGEALKA